MRVPDTHLAHGLESASVSSKKTEAILPILQKVRPIAILSGSRTNLFR